MSEQQRFHINNNSEVNPCSAPPGKCRFKDKEGQTNHFFSEDEAKKVAQKRLNEKYGTLANRKKKTTLKIYLNNKETSESLKRMESNGMIVKHIPSIKDHRFVRNDFSKSNIDLLDEKADKNFINQIRSGNYNFNS